MDRREFRSLTVLIVCLAALYLALRHIPPPPGPEQAAAKVSILADAAKVSILDPRRYAATLDRVHDGDTIIVDIELGLGVWLHGRSCRLIGIDAPELVAAAGVTSRKALEKKLAGQTILLQTDRDRTDKYGRLLVLVLIVDRAGGLHDVNRWLIEQGHAREYDGGKR